MRHFFLDTNVIFDYLGRREPNGAAAVELFQTAYEGKATLYVASLSFSHVFYTLRKQVGAVVAREALDSDFADVEDAMQYFAAASQAAVEAIVTGDPKGFKQGSLAVISPVEAQALVG